MCEGRGHTMQGAKEFFNICRCWLWETHEIIGLMWTFHTEKFFSYFIREEKFNSLRCSYFRSILTFLRNHTDLCAVANAQQYKDFIFSLRHKFKQVYPITQTKFQKNVLLTYHEVKFYLTIITSLCPKIYVQNRYVQSNDIRLEVLVICT